MMNKITRLCIYLLIFVMLLGVSIFIISPWIVKNILQQQLPEDVILEDFEMKLPTLQAVYFPKISFSQSTADGQKNKLEIVALNIQAEWPWQKMSKISMQSLTGSIDFIPSFASTEQTGVEPIAKQTPDSLADLELPIIEINNIQLDLLAQSKSPLHLQGQLTHAESLAKLVLKIRSGGNASQSTHLDLVVQKLNASQFDISAVSDIDLNELESLQFNQYKMPVLPVQLSKGKLAVNLDARVLVESFSSIQLENMSATINIQDATIKHHLGETQKLTALVDVNCNNFSCSQASAKISGNTLLSSEVKDLNKKSLNWTLSIEDFHSELKNDPNNNLANELNSASMLGKLTVEQQSLDFNINAASQDGRWNITNQLKLSMQQLNESWHASLHNIHLDSANADINIAATYQNASWNFDKPTTKNIRLKGLKYQYDYPLSIDDINVKIGWKKDWLEATLPFDSVILTAKQVTVDAKNYSSEVKSALQLNITNEKNAIKFDGKLTPIAGVTVQDKWSLITTQSDFSGRHHKKTALTEMQISTSTQLSNIKPLLKSVVKKNKKFIDDLKIQSTSEASSKNTTTIQGNLNLQLTQNYEMLLNGKLNSTVSSLTLANNQFTNMSMSLEWKNPDATYQPWFAFLFDITSELNLEKLDQQTHHLSGAINIQNEITYTNIKLESQLLGGTLTARANQLPRTLNESEGSLTLSGIDLERINRIINKKELKISGELSGTVPFHMQQNHLRFSAGELNSTSGIVEYLPDGKKKLLTKDSISDIASIALQNFHYKVLNAKVITGGPCGFDIKFRLEGRNPELGSTQDQIFNINYAPISNVNLYYLLLLGEDSLKDLDKAQLHSGCVNSQ